MDKVLNILEKFRRLEGYQLALDNIEVSQRYIEILKDWLLGKQAAPGAYVKNVVRRFGMGDRLELLPGEEKDRGEFFAVRFDSGKIILEPATDREKRESEVVVSFGIDTSGEKYLQKYMQSLEPVIPDYKKKNVIVYHYNTSPGERADIFDQLMHNHYYFSDEALRFANVFTLNPDNKKTYVGHSYGGLFDRMFRNALAYLSLERSDGVDYQNNLNSLVFGTFPIWGKNEAGEIAEQNLRSKYSEFQTSKSLFVISVEDILPYLPKYAMNAFFRAAEHSDVDLLKPYHAYCHPNNQNKVVVILMPGVIPSVSESGAANFAGHGLAHYVESVKPKNNELGIIMASANTKGMSGLKFAVQNIFEIAEYGYYSIHESHASLATSLGAEKMDKKMLEEMEIAGDHFLAAALIQLMEERKAWVSKTHSCHPFAGGKKIR